MFRVVGPHMQHGSYFFVLFFSLVTIWYSWILFNFETCFSLISLIFVYALCLIFTSGSLFVLCFNLNS